MNIWDAYKLGIRLYMRRRSNQKGIIYLFLNFLRHPVNAANCLTPIDYVRYREFGFVIKALLRNNFPPANLLDIGSPKLLPLTVASVLPTTRVWATDIMESEVRSVKQAASRLNMTNITSQVHDARVLGYRNGQFDVATSISVFEHIAPEKDGEVPAARELGRVVSSGGIAIVTVPFSRSYFAEYQPGRVYERISANGKPIFFQRFYDLDLLLKNIVEVSGMNIISLRFIGERYFFKDPHRRLAHYIDSSRKQRLVFGPWFPLLSRIFLSAPKTLKKCKKPYIACLILKKP